MDTRTCLKTLWVGACLSVVTGMASAAEIVRWVDADGVVHFGDRQAAPVRGAETVSVQRTNSMDVAVAPQVVPQGSVHVAKIERSTVENKRGFRGFNSRSKRAKGSHRRGTR